MYFYGIFGQATQKFRRFTPSFNPTDVPKSYANIGMGQARWQALTVTKQKPMRGARLQPMSSTRPIFKI